MKKQYIILLLFIIIAIVGSRLLFKNKSPEKVVSDFKESIEQERDGQICFLYEEQAPVELAGDNNDAYNREYIELSIAKDGNVAGIHNIVPYGIDSNFSSFIGVTDGEFVNTIATATAEGETWQEQRVYKMTEDKIFVGYQPVYVPQYQNEQEIYLYEDINQLVFDTDKFFLEKIDCNSFDTSLVL